MNMSALLKTLLPGLAPLLVYVAADAIFGEAVGLVVGLVVGAVEFVVSLVRNRKADLFVVADTILLGIAGGLSLLLKNEIFFKLKPAVVEAALGAGFGLLLVLPSSYLKGYMASQVRGIEIPDGALPAMKRNLTILLGILAAHVALTIWAALALPTAWWGFISGGLLYILFGVFALAQVVAARRTARRNRAAPAEEMLPIIDESGRTLGVLPRSECHKGPGHLHPVVHLHITDGEGRLYLQKRAASKDIEPGKWDTSVGEHVGAGETVEAALARELREELGVELPPPGSESAPRALWRYKWESSVESEMVFSFTMRYTGPFSPDPTEVEEGRFWSAQEIRDNVGKGSLTPNLEFELGMIRDAILAGAEKK